MARSRKLRGVCQRGVPARIRLFLALAVTGLCIYAYLSPGLAANGLLALLVKGQFSAALYGAGAAALAILALTALCGRFYCSVLCPLGTLQELVWRLGTVLRRNRRSRLFRAGCAKPPKIRYAIPLIVGVGAALAFPPLMLAVDPLSTVGRGMTALRAAFRGGGTPVVAVPLCVILIAAFFRGRAFCGWCPVGITLGLFPPVFAMRISPHCASCGQCEKKCPAGCIDAAAKRIDGSRCVLCFSCAAVCPAGSAAYGPPPKPAAAAASSAAVRPPDAARRLFLKRAGRVSLACGAAYLLGPTLKRFPGFAGGPVVSAASAGAASRPDAPILPPGAGNLRQYQARCIGCLACAASCPVGVIKARGLQPSLDYTGAGCQFNCVECGTVCPTGAIRRLAVEEKRRTRIALSRLLFERCVVNTRRESCGACAEVCPTGAVTMTAYGESGVPWLTRPVLDERYCIGCGACYAACPAEPRALIIEAVPEQALTVGTRPAEEAGDALRIESTGDFPF